MYIFRNNKLELIELLLNESRKENWVQNSCLYAHVHVCAWVFVCLYLCMYRWNRVLMVPAHYQLRTTWDQSSVVFSLSVVSQTLFESAESLRPLSQKVAHLYIQKIFCIAQNFRGFIDSSKSICSSLGEYRPQAKNSYTIPCLSVYAYFPRNWHHSIHDCSHFTK